MAQPATSILPDTKTSLSPNMNTTIPLANPNTPPPGYVPTTFTPSYPQGPSALRPSFPGQPSQQPAFRVFPLQSPLGAQRPLGPQTTGTGQQVPLGTRSPHQMSTSPMANTFPQQSLGAYPPNHQMPMNLQAQLGVQYQATQYGQCAMGNHARQTKYGILGIIGAIVFFPIGLICLFADQQEVCMRCGQTF